MTLPKPQKLRLLRELVNIHALSQNGHGIVVVVADELVVLVVLVVHVVLVILVVLVVLVLVVYVVLVVLIILVVLVNKDFHVHVYDQKTETWIGTAHLRRVTWKSNSRDPPSPTRTCDCHRCPKKSVPHLCAGHRKFHDPKIGFGSIDSTQLTHRARHHVTQLATMMGLLPCTSSPSTSTSRSTHPLPHP